MKKIFALTAALAVCLMVTSCGKKNPLPEDTSAIEQYIAEVSETMRTEETTDVTTTSETTVTIVETTAVTTEETIPLTPLEEAQAWADESPLRFLYDFTGDGFPESMELILEPYTLTGCISSEVYDWQDNIVNIVVDDCLYVCRDSNGKNFIVTYYSIDAMAGMTPYTAVRYDFYADGIHNTVLGETEIYFSGERYYTGICTFLGEDLDSGIGKNGGKFLNNRLMEYISEYELTDTITITYENNNFKANFEADTGFAEKASDSLPEYEITEPSVINYKNAGDSRYIIIDEETLENSFDFEVLNEFKELDHIEFDRLSDKSGEKIKIPKGDWCGKIKKMRININCWDTADFSAFSNVESIIIDGWNTERADLEFLKDMPSVRYIYAYFTADSAEAFIPLSEMSNLEAIIDSGHGSCMEKLSDEERAKVMELLPKEKYFWGMVK